MYYSIAEGKPIPSHITLMNTTTNSTEPDIQGLRVDLAQLYGAELDLVRVARTTEHVPAGRPFTLSGVRLLPEGKLQYFLELEKNKPVLTTRIPLLKHAHTTGIDKGKLIGMIFPNQKGLQDPKNPNGLVIWTVLRDMFEEKKKLLTSNIVRVIKEDWIDGKRNGGSVVAVTYCSRIKNSNKDYLDYVSNDILFRFQFQILRRNSRFWQPFDDPRPEVTHPKPTGRSK